MKFLALSVLFISKIALALECPSLNLVTEVNSPFNKLPVYDQDGIGICYAYSASQLVDYHLIKNGAAKRSMHPTWVALSHSIAQEKENISSGMTAAAINDVVKSRNCSYDIVNHAIGTWAKTANVTDSEIISVLEKFAPKYKMIYEGKKASSILQSSSFEITRNDITMALDEALTEQAAFQCSSNPTWDKLVPELHALSIMGSPKVFESLIFPACEGKKTSLNLPKANLYIPQNDDDYPLLISNRLQTLSAPVSVSYCSKVFKDKNYSGVVGRSGKVIIKNDCENHESLIVGQKKVGASCNFLLRNSWGNGFGDWNKNSKCLCKHKQTGAFVDDCTATTHNNGLYSVEACWIDETILGRNANAMTVLGGE